MAVSWVAASGCGFPAGSFVGGNEADGQKTYIIRATQVADLCPGKLSPSIGHAYVPYSGQECTKETYEVGGND